MKTIEMKTAKNGVILTKTYDCYNTSRKFEDAVAALAETAFDLDGKSPVLIMVERNDGSLICDFYTGGFNFDERKYIFTDKAGNEYSFWDNKLALKHFAKGIFGEVITVKPANIEANVDDYAVSLEAQDAAIKGEYSNCARASLLAFATMAPAFNDALKEIIASEKEMQAVDDYAVSSEAQDAAIEAEIELTNAPEVNPIIKEREEAKREYYEIKAVVNAAEKEVERVEKLRNRCKDGSPKRKAYNQQLADFELGMRVLGEIYIRANDRYNKSLFLRTDEERSAAQAAIEEINANYQSRGIKYIATVYYYPHGVEGEAMNTFSKDCKTFKEAAEFISQEEIEGVYVGGTYDAGWEITDIDGNELANANTGVSDGLIAKFDATEEPALTNNMKTAAEIVGSLGNLLVKFDHRGEGKNGGLAIHYETFSDEHAEFPTSLRIVEVFTDMNSYILHHVNVITGYGDDKQVTQYFFNTNTATNYQAEFYADKIARDAQPSNDEVWNLITDMEEDNDTDDELIDPPATLRDKFWQAKRLVWFKRSIENNAKFWYYDRFRGLDNVCMGKRISKARANEIIAPYGITADKFVIEQDKVDEERRQANTRKYNRRNRGWILHNRIVEESAPLGDSTDDVKEVFSLIPSVDELNDIESDIEAEEALAAAIAKLLTDKQIEIAEEVFNKIIADRQQEATMKAIEVIPASQPTMLPQTIISITDYNTLMLWAEKISNGQRDAVKPLKTNLKALTNAAIVEEDILGYIDFNDLNGFRSYLAYFNFLIKDDAGYLQKLYTQENGDCVLAEIPTSEYPNAKGNLSDHADASKPADKLSELKDRALTARRAFSRARENYYVNYKGEFYTADDAGYSTTESEQQLYVKENGELVTLLAKNETTPPEEDTPEITIGDDTVTFFFGEFHSVFSAKYHAAIVRDLTGCIHYCVYDDADTEVYNVSEHEVSYDSFIETLTKRGNREKLLALRKDYSIIDRLSANNSLLWYVNGKKSSQVKVWNICQSYGLTLEEYLAENNAYINECIAASCAQIAIEEQAKFLKMKIARDAQPSDDNIWNLIPRVGELNDVEPFNSEPQPFNDNPCLDANDTLNPAEPSNPPVQPCNVADSIMSAMAIAYPFIKDQNVIENVTTENFINAANSDGLNLNIFMENGEHKAVSVTKGDEKLAVIKIEPKPRIENPKQLRDSLERAMKVALENRRAARRNRNLALENYEYELYTICKNALKEVA